MRRTPSSHMPHAPARPPFARSQPIGARPRPLVLRFLLAAAPAALLACGEEGAPPPARPGARVATVAPTLTIPTRLFAGDSLVNVRVRALDAQGQPVAGAAVAFRATGGSRVARASAVTDSSGLATAGTWRLGTRTGRDSLVVSVTDGPTAHFVVPIVAGPVYALELMQRPTTGVVGVAMSPGVVFRARDRFGNPAAGAEIALRATDQQGRTGTARVPASIVVDDSGLARVGPWIPHVLGTHMLTGTVRDVWGEQLVIAQPVLTPACAPDQPLPITTTVRTEGHLGAVPSWPCGDEVDRYALLLDSSRALVVTGTGARVSVQRAGPMTEATLVAPARPPGATRVFLPAGDYEVVVGPRQASEPGVLAYTVQLSPAAAMATGCDTTWVAAAALIRQQGGTCAVDRPEASLPAGSTVAVFGVAAGSLPARQLRVGVQAIPVAGVQARRVIAVYGRRRATGEQQLLGVLPNTSTEHALAVTIPAGWDDAIVLVGHPAGENGLFDVELR